MLSSWASLVYFRSHWQYVFTSCHCAFIWQLSSLPADIAKHKLPHVMKSSESVSQSCASWSLKLSLSQRVYFLFLLFSKQRWNIKRSCNVQERPDTISRLRTKYYHAPPWALHQAHSRNAVRVSNTIARFIEIYNPDQSWRLSWKN